MVAPGCIGKKSGDAGTSQPTQKLRLSALIALVVGSMIGGGIFSLPQNMAARADAGGVVAVCGRGEIPAAVGVAVCTGGDSVCQGQT